MAVIGAPFSRAWRRYPQHAGPILLLCVGWAATWVLIEILVFASSSRPGHPVWVVLHAGFFWLTAYWEAAILACVLAATGGESFRLLDTLGNHRLAARVFIAKLLYLPLVLAGLALLLLPGLYLLARFGLAFLYLADRGTEIRRAFSLSERATLGNRAGLMGFFGACLLLNFVGLSLMGLGLIVSVPLTVLAMGEVYRSLTRDTP